MVYRSSIVLVAILAFVFGKDYFTPTPAFDEKESLILHGVMQFVDQVHYEPKPIDDEFSESVFNTYLKRLDGGKRYLLKADVEQLSAYKHLIDDQVEVRTFEFFDLSNKLFKERLEQSKGYYESLIDDDFDFTANESIDLNEDNMDWAKDEKEMKEYWRKFLKYEIMSRVARDIEKQEAKEDEMEDLDIAPSGEIEESAGGEEEEIKIEDKKPKTKAELIEKAREDVKERFDDYFERMNDLRRSDRFELYVGTITSYFDPHTNYFNPKEKQDFDINMGGKLEGIGARLRQEDDYITVVEIIAGGPAYKGKELEVDDKFLAVTQEGGEPVDVVGMRTDDAIQMIRGKKGTVVILTIQKPDGTIKDIRIERDEVIIDESFAKSTIINMPDLIENVGYIKLPKFYSSFEKEGGNSCAKDVAMEIEKLKENNVNGIILDLRNNTGGSLNDVVEMSGLFIEKGPIVQVKSKTSKPYIHADTDPQVQYSGPLIVMVNNNSASASEILAAAMQDYGRAIIVGNSTFGKGTVQRFYDLDRAIRGGSEFKPLGNIKMSVQKFFRVNGGSTQLKGVIPDVILPDNYSYIESGEKEYDHAMPWTEIAPKQYSQKVVKLNNLDKIVVRSKSRVKADEDFQLADERALLIKKNEDMSVYSLNLDKYMEYRSDREQESKKFKNLMKDDIDGMVISNLPQDLPKFDADESKAARNEQFVKSLKKDFYLEETMKIMYDMITSETSFASIADKMKEKG